MTDEDVLSGVEGGTLVAELLESNENLVREFRERHSRLAFLSPAGLLTLRVPAQATSWLLRGPMDSVEDRIRLWGAVVVWDGVAGAVQADASDEWSSKALLPGGIVWLPRHAPSCAVRFLLEQRGASHRWLVLHNWPSFEAQSLARLEVVFLDENDHELSAWSMKQDLDDALRTVDEVLGVNPANPLMGALARVVSASLASEGSIATRRAGLRAQAENAWLLMKHFESVVPMCLEQWTDPWGIGLGRHGPSYLFRYMGRKQRQRVAIATKLVLEALGATGLRCSVAYGTALGAVREADLIPHDDDVDLHVFVPHDHLPEEVISSCQSALESLGMRLIPTQEGSARHHFYLAGFAEYVARDDGPKGVHADLFFVFRDDQGHADAVDLPRAIRWEAVSTVTEGVICGVSVPLPGVAEAYLAGRYGPDWRTPVRVTNFYSQQV